MSNPDRLARARADKHELHWVRHRLDEAREDRKRVAAQLAISEQARGYEQADVDALTHGVRGFFRRLVADHTQLSIEQQEVAAAELVCDELTDELRAIDADLAQLTVREAAVAHADARYAEALSEAESAARARGELHAELDALAAADAELTASRRDLLEITDLGVAVQKTFVSVVQLVRDLKPRDEETTDAVLGEHLWPAITGSTRRTYHDLCGALADAQQGLRRFEQMCRELPTGWPAGIELELRLEPLPPSGSFVLRDVLWSNGRMLEAILPAVSRVSSDLSTIVGGLRARDAALGQAQAECARLRGRLLDPGAPSR